MPAQTTPPVTIAKPQGGVLPISAVTDKNNSQPPSASKGAQPKAAPPQKTKVVLRRLPPGITQPEVEAALGEEWKPGNGKITWTLFKPGKISKDMAKTSRPARLYMQISDPASLDILTQTVAKSSFNDARASANDSVLVGPPCLEYAPYGRVPNNRRRNDARQGTIDQDPEFIEFLESLTNPITKPKALDAAAVPKDEPMTVTPLIQHLRDKKAAKEKAASNKAAKHQKQDSKDTAKESKTGRKRGATKESSKPSDEKTNPARPGDRRPKESVKSPSRKERAQATATQKATAGNAPEKTSAAASSSQATTAPASKRTDAAAAANGSAAARMLQRDLGLKSGNRGGGRAARAPKAAADAPASPAQPDSHEPPAKPGKDSAAQRRADTPPASSPAAQNTKAQPKPAPAPAAKPARPPAVDPTATRAFLKHANPSQGITEPLLKAAMAPFGDVQYVEIDKRKGFAFVTFAAPAALQAAIAASPVPVAGGCVTVLARVDRAPGPPAAAAAATAGAGGNSGRGARNAAASTANNGGNAGQRGRGARARAAAPRGGPNAAAAPTAAAGDAGAAT